jgi:hypothetical protein
MSLLLDKFKNPSAEFRSAPLWVWNDAISEEQIRLQLTELKNHGFGGAFVHPRPGMITEYLSEGWFSLWGYALKVAKELGLKLYIYDENSYPSGFAGGHVSSQLPDCWALSAAYRILPKGEAFVAENRNTWRADVNLIKAFTFKQAGDRITFLDDVTERPQEEWEMDKNDIFIVEKENIKTSSWLADMAYVDLLRPEVTKLFLKVTYDGYYKHFSEDFGDTIPAIFTDEPGLFGSAIYEFKNSSIPYSSFVAEEFRRRRGYSLLDHLPCIFLPAESKLFEKPDHKVRYDFYTTVRELWTENFIKPISTWCIDHKVAFTGHFMEHQWPLACGEVMSPSIMQNYVYQQWPGIDYLLTKPLRDKADDMLLVTILELRSVVNQFGKKRALCETFGAGGWDSVFMDYKRIGDHLMVNGINVLNEHLTYGTITGARKRDHPQSFDWRQSWWDDYRDLNDYFGRVCAALTEGVSRQRILVLHPTTTGYLTPRNKESSNIMWDQAPTEPNMLAYMELLQSLTDSQWDFDLGDEGILREYAEVMLGKLKLPCQTYDVVVISGDMKNFTSPTLGYLSEFLDSGGSIIALGKPGGYLDGDLDSQGLITRLFSKSNALIVDTYATLEAELKKLLTCRIHSNTNIPRGFSHLRRELDDGSTLYFFVNHSMDDYFETTLTLEGMGVERLDCWTGNTEALPTQKVANNRVSFHLHLSRNESSLLLVSPGAVRNIPVALIPQTTPVPVTLKSVRAEEDNVLTIDYCDLCLDGKEYKDMNAFDAGNLIFRKRGFEHNPWDNSVQYKSNIMNRNNYCPGSGFTVTYHFILEGDSLLGRLSAIVERAEFYNIVVNGITIPWKEGAHWLDHHNGVADITSALKKGENSITLTAPVFDVLLELESIYLRGNFNAEIKSGHWVLRPKGNLNLGDWTKQGYPFYAGAVQYSYEFTAQENTGYTIQSSDWLGASCSVWVNEKRIGLLNRDGIKALELTGVKAGTNQITLRISGTMKNLLGPHHNPDKPRGSAWPQMWRAAPCFGAPQAENYDLIPMGLLKDISIFQNG